MKFNEYQELAERTANSESEGMSVRNHRLANFGMGISGEAGEVTDYLKKVVFHNHTLDVAKVKKELGDVLWYIATLATTVDIDLEEIALANIEKLKRRYPKGFSEERSRNRAE